VIRKILKYNPCSTFHILWKGFFFICIFFIPFLSFAQTNVNILKAVYLEKISRFVTWPDACMMNDINQPFIISIIGQTELSENLQLVY